MAVVSLAVLSLVLGGIVVAQPGGGGGGFGGPPGGFGRGPTVVFGTVAAADIASGILQVDSQGNQVTLYPVRATQLSHVVTITPAELAVGDQVTVNGVPIGIWATRLIVDDVSASQPQDQAGPPAGVGMGRGMFGMGFGGAMAMATGQVTSLDPLKIQFSQTSPQGDQQFEAVVTLADNANLSNVVPGDWNSVQPGQTVFGMANPDEQGRLVLTSLTIVDNPEAFMSGMGPGMGMGMMGPRGGGRRVAQ